MGMPFLQPLPFLKRVNEEIHRNRDFYKVKFPPPKFGDRPELFLPRT